MIARFTIRRGSPSGPVVGHARTLAHAEALGKVWGPHARAKSRAHCIVFTDAQVSEVLAAEERAGIKE